MTLFNRLLSPLLSPPGDTSTQHDEASAAAKPPSKRREGQGKEGKEGKGQGKDQGKKAPITRLSEEQAWSRRVEASLSDLSWH